MQLDNALARPTYPSAWRCAGVLLNIKETRVSDPGGHQFWANGLFSSAGRRRQAPFYESYFICHIITSQAYCNACSGCGYHVGVCKRWKSSGIDLVCS